MNIFQQLFGRTQQSPAPRAPQVVHNGFSFNSGTSTKAGVIIRPEDALKDATVLACVHTIASTVAQLPIGVIDVNGVDVSTGKLPALLKRPNEYQTSYSLKYSMVSSLLTHGNIFLRVIMTKSGVPVQIVPIDPSEMTISNNVMGMPIYEHNTHGVIPTKEVIHVQDVAGFNSTGLSRVVLAAERIAALIAADQLIGDTFRNGINVSHVFTAPQGTPKDKMDQMRSDLQTRYANDGINRGGGILLEGATLQAVKGATPADADLRAIREHLIQEIASVFRIPASMVGGGESAKYSNLRQSQTSFYRDTISPITESIQQAFDLKLGDANQSVVFDVSSLMKGDQESQVRMYTQAITGGFLTPNEARESLGYQPMEGGDELATSASETNVDDLRGSVDQPNGMNPEATNEGDSDEKE